MAANGVEDGTLVRAKRLGWDEVLTPVQEFDLEPFDPSRGTDLEGVLWTAEGVLPSGRPVTSVTVGGQEADPKTVEPLTDAEVTNFDYRQARDTVGRFTRGAGASVGRGVKRAKALGAYLDGKGEERGGKAYRAGKKIAHAVEQGMMVLMKQTQKVAAQAAKERGLPDTHVERVARVTAAVDFATSFALSKGATLATGGNPVAGFAAGMLPSASVAYLAYSTARNPKATLRAARKLVRGELNTATRNENWADEMVTNAHEDELLTFFAEAADPDWAEAVLAACLESQPADVKGALAEARRVLEANPVGPAYDEPEAAQ